MIWKSNTVEGRLFWTNFINGMDVEYYSMCFLENKLYSETVKVKFEQGTCICAFCIIFAYFYIISFNLGLHMFYSSSLFLRVIKILSRICFNNLHCPLIFILNKDTYVK